MMGSHTATTLSMRSQAAPMLAESSVKAAARVRVLRDVIERLRVRLKLGKSSPRPVHEQFLDHEEQEICAVAHAAGHQDRTVHVGELIGDLSIDDAVAEAIHRPDE